MPSLQDVSQADMIYTKQTHKSDQSNQSPHSIHQPSLSNTFPFISLRIIETCKKIWKADHGPLGFYRGLLPSLIGMIPYAGVSFYSYDKLKKYFARKWSGDGNGTGTGGYSQVGVLVAGGISGALAQTVSYPFEVVRRRMQVATATIDTTATSSTTTKTTSGGDGGHLNSGVAARRSMLQTARAVVAERGVRGLFVGLGIGYIKVRL